MRRFVLAAVYALLLCGAQAAMAQMAQQAPPPSARGAEAQSPAIPFRKDEDTGALAINVITGLVVSVGIGIGVLFLLRRYLTRMQQGPGRRLRVIESVRLTPKSTLFLVECDGQALLIGQQGESLVVLSPASPVAPRAEARADAGVASAPSARHDV